MDFRKLTLYDHGIIGTKFGWLIAGGMIHLLLSSSNVQSASVDLLLPNKSGQKTFLTNHGHNTLQIEEPYLYITVRTQASLKSYRFRFNLKKVPADLKKALGYVPPAVPD